MVHPVREEVGGSIRSSPDFQIGVAAHLWGLPFLPEAPREIHADPRGRVAPPVPEGVPVGPVNLFKERGLKPSSEPAEKA